MKNILFVLFNIMLLFSCSQNSDEKETSKDTSASEVVIPDNKICEQKVKDFYTWYLNNYFNKSVYVGPACDLIGDSVYRLDTTTYFKFLKETNYFSTGYLKNVTNEFSDCNKQLAGIKSDECPALFADSCSFISYDNWLLHEGIPTEDIEIIKSSSEGKTAEVLFNFLAKRGDTSTKFQTMKVLLVKEKKDWRIERIER